MNDLFDGELTDQDRLVCVNDVLKGKLLESPTLIRQASNNTKEQFANSPGLKSELMKAIVGALDAHTAMSTQALGSEAVRQGLKDVLLDNASLSESLRGNAIQPPGCAASRDLLAADWYERCTAHRSRPPEDQP